jgi:drug/metabolite transporter (DMT)-like permease
MALVWGPTWAAIKIGLQALPPLLLASASYVLTAAMLAVVVRGADAADAEGRAGRGGTGTGLAAIVGGTAISCLGSVVVRRLVGPVQQLALTAVQAVIGGAALLALSVAFEPLSFEVARQFLTPEATGKSLFLLLLGTIVGYTIFQNLLREWGTVRAGLYAFISPIVALAIGALMFGEHVGPAEIGGGFLCLSQLQSR